MGQGISEVLPVCNRRRDQPDSDQRAKVNGPVFLVGWVIGLSVAVAVVYAIANAANAATDSTSSDTVSWLKVGLGVVLLGAARRNWAKRPAPGEEAMMPKWMAGVDHMKPGGAFGLGIVCSAVNPKNLILAAGAAAGVAQIPGLSTEDAVVALVVFVLLASVSLIFAVGYYLFGGESAHAKLDELKLWLSVYNNAVMATLFLVFGVVLISKGLNLLNA